MNVLALDTSMGNCSAAVLRDGGELLMRGRLMPRGHAEALMPMVETVMREAGLGASDLARIAATTGPGSFTGVRIAIAAARGLALVTGADLWGTDSLSVMAARAVIDKLAGGKPFAVAVDARRGALYFGLYAKSGERLEGPLLVTPTEAAAMLPPDTADVVGSGAAALAEAASGWDRAVRATALSLQPDAAALAGLAATAPAPTPDLRPLYLRPPDAKPQSGLAVERC
jgi:tRNA threonylcarbamoyladenosine biosynthesis protein TsaB